ncbi:CRISPR-associated endonuclease Cas2 [Aggregatilinea lenta]|uniref:CRISPR-associated endonuclease Cas2 n=1 Tax=Aggregatilinea lenta TaxID=913108 RepID=UPI000E5C498F|nr:CRISPR-associated endonuclease Cas2 [Aggregatilinea lenta]
MFWVVCYDIPDDKRRRKVVKIMEGAGRRVQYSVFECEINNARLERLKRDLQRAIDDEEDDVRFYPLNEGDIPKIITLARATLERTRGHYVV